MTEGVYTPSKEIKNYHLHKHVVRYQTCVRFFTLVAIIVVTLLFIKANKDAYDVKTTIDFMLGQLGVMQADYTFLSTGSQETYIYELLNKGYILTLDIFKLQMLLAMILLVLGVVYEDSSYNIKKSKKALQQNTYQVLRA